MRKFFPVEELARDERFNKITMRDRMADPRTRVRAPASQARRQQTGSASRPSAATPATRRGR